MSFVPPPQPLPSVPAPPPSLLNKVARSISARPMVALGLIVALVILVLYLVVQYRGLLGLGPFAAGPPPFKRRAMMAAAGPEPAPPAPQEKADPETERLIESLNRR